MLCGGGGVNYVVFKRVGEETSWGTVFLPGGTHNVMGEVRPEAAAADVSAANARAWLQPSERGITKGAMRRRRAPKVLVASLASWKPRGSKSVLIAEG